MGRTRPAKLTPLEALVMDCVWEAGEVTVRQVQECIRARRKLAYNTVLTVMRILREKGFLASERQGRMDVYRPLVAREQVARRSLSDVIERFFQGSATALVSQLLQSEELSDEELKGIRREVSRQLETSDREAEGG
jgi:predicted transcriptional regulator